VVTAYMALIVLVFGLGAGRYLGFGVMVALMAVLILSFFSVCTMTSGTSDRTRQ
jgi:hypothetical protein